MDFKGTIIAVLPLKKGAKKDGSGEWKSQEYVIENLEGKFPRKMCFNVFGEDKINAFGINVGDVATVSFEIDAKQWQDRWFNSINAWKYEKVSSPKTADVQTDMSKREDDLPF